jgi:DNA mismatch repair ATPase MutS
MLALIEREELTTPSLKALQARLRGATLEMRSLGRILGFLEARNNEVWRFFIGPALMWDLNCVIFLERWRDRTGKRVRDWFVVLGEIEALASLAGYAFERPDHAMPELADAPTFEAKGLGHPLLREDKRVDNDVALAGPGHGLIVTGSNMSGKSTLLRAMGANSVLALAGAPVCARALRIGPVRVVTSMRVRDSLEEGVSHFYAELQKLKRVIDLSRRKDEGTVFFLLDEILHGTNSRERILGARAIIKELLSRGAMGAVSTHDLGISDLDREISGDVLRNVHFEEQVEGDRMTFDYTLRNGIVQSSNALRLMKLVGIDVVSPDA